MQSLDFSRYVLGICATTAMLAGCGGTTVPPSATAQSITHQATSSSGGYIYARDSYDVDIFTYPGVKFVQSFQANGTGRLCADSKGHVFVPAGRDEENGTSYIDEYANGGTSPIAILQEKQGYEDLYPVACSWDPNTGNLAVVNLNVGSEQHNCNVAIFENAQGSPTFINDVPQNIVDISYDNESNLYFAGGWWKSLAELPNGTSKWIAINIPAPVTPNFLQWDGTYIAVLVQGTKYDFIDRLSISGSEATIVKAIHFGGMKNEGAAVPFWIQGNTIILSVRKNKKHPEFAVYPYPSGGKAETIVGGYPMSAITATVSYSSSQKRN